MKNINITVTVSLAAYNEEANIGNLLQSILNQKEDKFTLKQILIVSDGSTDNTVKIVKSFKNSKIKLVDSKKRLGLATRLNQIYSTFDSDYLIQTDADVVFSNEHVIKYLVDNLKNENVAMCGGDVIPVKPKNFTQKAIFCSVDIYRKLAIGIKEGRNIFTVNGPLLAYKNIFVKEIKIPAEMMATDKYMYLKCIQKKQQYKFVKKAVVYYELPKTLRDHIKQIVRFKKSKMFLDRVFPKKLLDHELKIPKKMFFRILLSNFIEQPISFIYIFIINRYCMWLVSIDNNHQPNVLWDKLERSEVAVK